MYEFVFQALGRDRGLLSTCHSGKAQLVIAGGENGRLRKEPRVPVKVANLPLVLQFPNSVHLDKSFLFAGPQFPYQQNEAEITSFSESQ